TYTSKFPNVPIVVLTSLADESLVNLAMTSGAQDYLDKSLLRGDVVDRSIRYALERRGVMNRLEQKNSELQRFAYTLAHEVRSPLQVVRSALEESREVTVNDPDESLRKLIAMGIESSDHIAHVVQELLEFSQEDADQVPLGPLDITAIVFQVIDHVQIQEANAAAQFEVEKPLPTVIGSETQLRHVFQNLLINAIRYRGPNLPLVRITSEEFPDHVDIRIQDNGIGIPAKHHRRIFEFLYRVDAHGPISGTGIGLGFCKQILERTGGSIRVESEEGAGSTFIIRLPRKAQVANAKSR
ncbi:MAG: HAMP domain-containing sensor histidine kinase, partial [Chthoniobacterales bacterium]